MKTVFLKRVAIVAIAALSIVLLGSCSKDDPVNNPNDPGNPGTTVNQTFGVKKATVVYDFLGTTTLYFDNNGAQVCVEYIYGMSDIVPDERYIWDSSTKKAYYLDTTNKTYQEVTQAEVNDKLAMFFFTEKIYSAAGSGFTKTTETIAGKSCSIYTGSVLGSETSIGGWSGILFVMTMEGSDWIRAKSFSETVPADIFKIPSGFAKQ